MTKLQKPIANTPSNIQRQTKVLITITEAGLTTLANTAHHSGEQELYNDLRSFYATFKRESEVLLRKIGVTAPKKQKTNLRSV